MSFLTMLGEPKISTLADLFVGELADVGNWVVANVRSGVAWPLRVQAVDFRGHRIFLVPRSASTVVADGSTITHYPFAAVNMPAGTEFKVGRRLLSHFLSSLSWDEGAGITVEHWTGGSRAHPMGQSRMGGVVIDQLELEYLPDPTDERVRWALAFYREGLSLYRDNVAYATLSFFKVLNIVANNGPKQITWVNANIARFGTTNLLQFELKKRLDELRLAGITDIGEYLYASGRCAVAHAGTDPTVDPENPEDIERLLKDLPLTRAMAALVIEIELGVKSRHTIWDEHLYELTGFRELLGETLATRLKERDTTVKPEELTTLLHRISVRIKDHATYDGLENLTVKAISVGDGRVHLTATSDSNVVSIRFVLDFPSERIVFDFGNDLQA